MSEQPKFDKFIFETDFFEVAIQEEQERNAPTITEEDIAQAEARGYREGLAKGQAQGKEALKEEMDAYLQPIQANLEDLSQAKAQADTMATQQALTLMRRMLKKMVFSLAEKYPEDLLKEAITSSLSQVMNASEIVLKVSSQAQGFLQQDEKIKQVFDEKKVVLRVDDTLASGQCVLEWDGSGVVVSLEAAWKEVEQRLEAAIGEDQTEEEMVKEEAVSSQEQPQIAPQAGEAAENVEISEGNPATVPEEAQEMVEIVEENEEPSSVPEETKAEEGQPQ